MTDRERRSAAGLCPCCGDDIPDFCRVEGTLGDAFNCQRKSFTHHALRYRKKLREARAQVARLRGEVERLRARGLSQPAVREHLNPSDATLDALRRVRDAVMDLTVEGWRCDLPAPLGQTLLVVEAGSLGVFRGQRSPTTGHFFIEDGGDLYPSRPLAWKLDTDEEAGDG